MDYKCFCLFTLVLHLLCDQQCSVVTPQSRMIASAIRGLNKKYIHSQGGMIMLAERHEVRYTSHTRYSHPTQLFAGFFPKYSDMCVCVSVCVCVCVCVCVYMCAHVCC